VNTFSARGPGDLLCTPRKKSLFDALYYPSISAYQATTTSLKRLCSVQFWKDNTGMINSICFCWIFKCNTTM